MHDQINAPTAANTKPISDGDFLLWRKVGGQLRKGIPGGPSGKSGSPRFRHPTQEAAETEARRLLLKFPESTFVVLQEVARVKMKPVDLGQCEGCGKPFLPSDEGRRWADDVRTCVTCSPEIDPDAATGCADDQAFSIGGKA